MSLRSMSVQKKLKDDRFVGDLMSLFERRKIKTGDPSSLETFASTLESNDAFRSQLFALCTAISHMSEADLSGEQLLALVARALAGTEVLKEDGTADVPDSMRTAFLSAYDAWTKRSSEPKEPLPWPTARPSESQDQPLSAQQSANQEPATRRTPPPGMHTVQEALDIARERALANAPAASSPVAKIEGLTLSELKDLLAEIENRVNRIQPHLRDLNAITQPPADDFGPRDRMRTAGTPAADGPSPSTDVARADVPADSPTIQVSHRTARSSNLNEAAFLARHSYLRPSRRIVPATPAAGAVPAAAATAAAPNASDTAPNVAVAPAIPLASPEPVPVSSPIDFSQFTRVAPPTTSVESVAGVPVVLPVPPPVAPAAAAAATVPFVVPAPSAITVLPPASGQPDPAPYIPYDDEPTSLAIGKLRITPRMAAGILIAFASLIVVVSCLAGLFIYPSLHPKTLSDFPGLGSQPADTAPAPGASTSAQVIVAAAPDPSSAPTATQSHAAAAPKSRAHAPEPTPVGVWPATNAAPQRDAATSIPPLPAPAIPRGVQSKAAPVYVPSATLIGYALSAPQPNYPRDQPRGINGTVVVQITVSRDGYVTDIRVVSGPIEMRPATVQAVQSWRFRPYLVNGAPSEVVSTLGFLFKGQ